LSHLDLRLTNPAGIAILVHPALEALRLQRGIGIDEDLNRASGLHHGSAVSNRLTQ